ncbi:Hsp33 family molecular chaperone HslO [Marinobacter sp. M1N3S26]|uniref:Hsp33 family molecular chaperone HslO n=1 Tax=unclassified Marinobacter TaxID=83889 RepID=UPI00387A947F
MQAKDQFRKFLFEHSQIRGAWVHLTDSYGEILAQTRYPTPVTRLLGESLAASVLMSSTLKFHGTLSLQANGDGPVTTLLAECSHDRHIRGIARFEDADGPRGDNLNELLGQGRMAITITPEQGQRYQGVVPRESDTLAGALEEYFERSEQLATRLFLFADGEQCAGLLLQRLPGATEEDNELWERVAHLAATISADELLGLDSETVLHRLFHEEEVRLFDREPVAFRCTCSRERTLAALQSLGRDECYNILEEQGSIEMDCQFCHAHYQFQRIDIDQLFSGHTLH